MPCRVIADRDETGAHDAVNEMASRAGEVVAAGFAGTDRLQASFRYSADSGATWTLGVIDPASTRDLPPDAAEQPVHVVVGDADWLAIGISDDHYAVWISSDGTTWSRHRIDDRQLNHDTDSVYQLLGSHWVIAGATGDRGENPALWVSRNARTWTTQPITAVPMTDDQAVRIADVAVSSTAVWILALLRTRSGNGTVLVEQPIS